MSRYLIVIEGEGDSYSAYAPDVPGCVAAADSREEVVSLMREAMGFHLESLREHGDPVPAPSATGSEMIDVDDHAVQRS